MSKPKVAPYGSWKSPITSDLIVAGSVGLGGITWDGADIYWLEMRPSEGGRNAIVRRTPDGKIADVTPRDFNVRTRVHEYGGGSFAIADGTIYFSNFADQRIYRQTLDGQPEPITPEGAMRYADYILDKERGRLIAVREDHRGEGEPVNTIVSINLHNSEDIQILVSGNDFYANPRLSADGKQLCWITWNHPNMPWDGTELWVASVQEDGSLLKAELIDGGPNISIFQPEWSEDGSLYFVSDRTGWWNLYKFQRETEMPLCEMAAEFGLPQWVFGMSTYALASPNEIICTYSQNGITCLAKLSTKTGKLEPINTPYTSMSGPKVSGNQVLLIAGSATTPTSVVLLDLNSGEFQVLRKSSQLEIDPGYLSAPQSVEFPTEHELSAYGIFYPPKNQDYQAPEGELPPLVVKSHGGPTAAADSSLNLRIQYWTSRGFAVLDVNYGGSTGYGRPYRDRLKGQWGVVDVDDCVNGAAFLAEHGFVDENRLCIAGGSAGGYTTLCALTFRDRFKAGASYYGVSDLEALATDTHKFESRYLDRLIGPYPEKKELYRQRSPIHYCDRLSCPVIFFQGLEDKIVPPNQTEMMVDALKAKGLPVAYIAYEGEQHGFRRAENIIRTIDGEFYFYAKVFGFEPAEDLTPVPIENLQHL
jgi:dipeptidyl aminopeptidase/acylaminoacyl peptidase